LPVANTRSEALYELALRSFSSSCLLRWVLRASRAFWGRSIVRRLAFLGSEILLDEALANGNVEAVE